MKDSIIKKIIANGGLLQPNVLIKEADPNITNYKYVLTVNGIGPYYDKYVLKIDGINCYYDTDEQLKVFWSDSKYFTNPRNAGRKPLPDNLKAKIRSFKLTDDDYEKFKRLGSTSWLREILKSY